MTTDFLKARYGHYFLFQPIIGAKNNFENKLLFVSKEIGYDFFPKKGIRKLKTG